MILAMRTGVYGDQPFEEMARAIGEAGYDAVVLDLDAARFDLSGGGITSALADRIADVFEREGLSIGALGVTVDLAGDPAVAMELLLAALRLAGEFGTDLVVADLGAGGDRTALLERLREAVAEVDSREVALALDPSPDGPLGDLDQAELLLDALESDFLGLALDVLNVADDNDIAVAELLERVGDALLMVFVTDVSEEGDLVPPSPHGTSDFGELFDLLSEYAPDALVVPGALTSADAVETRAYLGRFR